MAVRNVRGEGPVERKLKAGIQRADNNNTI